LHRFWDMATYWLKIAYFSYPSLIRRPRSLCFLWNFAVKSSMCGSIFIQICAMGSKRRIFSAPESTRVRFGHSRSSKVDDLGTNRKRVWDFLLVGHCNYGFILHRLWDTATYWLKFAYLSYPTLIRRPRSLCSLWNFSVKLSLRKLESWGYARVKTGWS